MTCMCAACMYGHACGVYNTCMCVCFMFACVNKWHVVVFFSLFRNLTKEVRLYAQKFIDKGRVSCLECGL